MNLSEKLIKSGLYRNTSLSTDEREIDREDLLKARFSSRRDKNRRQMFTDFKLS